MDSPAVGMVSDAHGCGQWLPFNFEKQVQVIDDKDRPGHSHNNRFKNS